MAACGWPSGFSRWLFKHREYGEAHPFLVDLARESYLDPHWPGKGANFFEFYDYLSSLGCDAAQDTLISAYSIWSGVNYRRILRRIDSFYDGLPFFDAEDLEPFQREILITDTSTDVKRGCTYLYVLHIDEQVGYVGKTCDPIKRFRQHILGNHSEAITNWLSKNAREFRFPRNVYCGCRPTNCFWRI